jgi:hypothetical protein
MDLLLMVGLGIMIVGAIGLFIAFGCMVYIFSKG